MATDITILTDEYKRQFRTLYLEGKTIKDINAILAFNQNTFDTYYYLNKYGLRDYLTDIKKERVLQTVERFSDELMDIDAKENAKMKAIQQKEAEFLRETLLKEQGYTKRIETIGFNVNKNEPLDDEQKAKLDKLTKKAKIKVADYTTVVEQSQEANQAPIANQNTTTENSQEGIDKGE